MSMHSSRFYDLVMASFVAVLLVSNVASSAKIVDWGVSFFGLRLAFDAGTLLFPISYILGDILTEIYGESRARRVIFMGFIWMGIASLIFFLIRLLPGEAAWQSSAGDAAYGAILGGVSSGGIMIASLCGYLLGSLSNARIMALMKPLTRGRFLWTRTIGSTIVGEGIDTVVFVLIACAFRVFPWAVAVSLIIANYVFKVGIEVLFTPVTYKVVAFLKKAEGEDSGDCIRETMFRC